VRFIRLGLTDPAGRLNRSSKTPAARLGQYAPSIGTNALSCVQHAVWPEGEGTVTAGRHLIADLECDLAGQNVGCLFAVPVRRNIVSVPAGTVFSNSMILSRMWPASSLSAAAAGCHVHNIEPPRSYRQQRQVMPKAAS
jgi:hypothetical protein